MASELGVDSGLTTGNPEVETGGNVPAIAYPANAFARKREMCQASMYL